MAQFLVLAYDGTDAEAPGRRLAARSAHLDSIRSMVDRGELVAGGPIMDDAGKVIGSVALVDLPNRAEVDAWLAREPYVTSGVWQEINVRPMRIVVREGTVQP